MLTLLLTVLFACWGSFLNVLGYRLVREESIIFPGSHCPYCNSSINWYDNIPILSWFALLGTCRSCKKTISPLYPFIELFTIMSLLLLVQRVELAYFFAYFIFFSALIVTIRSDIETLLISRFTTLFLVPLGWLFALLRLLPITLFESILGTIIGYGFLYIISKLFYKLRKIEGIGQGDLELLAFIGSFTGFIGCWFTLFMSSILGLITGITYVFFKKKNFSTRIPFGPFLAVSAIVYVLLEAEILYLLFLTQY